MFEHHRKSPWFAEKYDPAPDFQNLRTRVRKIGWKGRLDSFLHELDLGKFDPDHNEPELEPSSPVKDNVTNGEGVAADATVAVRAGTGEEPKANGGDDEMQFNIEADEEAGGPETNGKSTADNKRPNRGEEISVPPEGNQVMIRTIPPDIGRVKLEEVR